VEATTMSWTDERLDDFREETTRRFDEVDRRFKEAKEDTAHRFDEVDRRFNEVDRRFKEAKEDTARRFDKVDAEVRGVRGEIAQMVTRIDGLHRTMIVTNGAIIAGLIGVIVRI
jgi:hypothetical protein